MKPNTLITQASYASVKAFAATVAKLERVDIAKQCQGSEDNENTIPVHVISTALLTLLLLPMLTLLGFQAQHWTRHLRRWLRYLWPDWLSRAQNTNLHATFNDEETANMEDWHASPRSSYQLHALSNLSSLTIPSQWLKHHYCLCHYSWQIRSSPQNLAVRAIMAGTATKTPFVVVDTVNPGFWYTDLKRNAGRRTKDILKMTKAMIA